MDGVQTMAPATDKPSSPNGRPQSWRSDGSRGSSSEHAAGLLPRRVPSRKPVPPPKDPEFPSPTSNSVERPPRYASLPQYNDPVASSVERPPIPTAAAPVIPTLDPPHEEQTFVHSRGDSTLEAASGGESGRTTPVTQNLAIGKGVVRHVPNNVVAAQQAVLSVEVRPNSFAEPAFGEPSFAEPSFPEPSFALNGDIRDVHEGQLEDDMERLRLEQRSESYPQLQYHHHALDGPPNRADPYTMQSTRSASPASTSNSGGRSSFTELQVPRTTLARPNSAHTLGADLDPRGRKHSSHLSVGGSPSPRGFARNASATRLSTDARPVSYIDQLSYMPPAPNLDNSFLRAAVGSNASLLDSKRTLEMYRANVKKTNDPKVQHEFAKMLVQMAKDQLRHIPPTDAERRARQDLLKEAKEILTRAASRGHDESQYYLGDGFFTGLFNKDKEDWTKAYELFQSATKQGHKEAAFRAALCTEFGWGTSIDYAKAREFFRASASWGHPGAATRFGKACITGDLGLIGRQFQREGIRWLGIAARKADEQYNAGPYELGLLHEVGYGDAFYDEEYAAQLYTESAKFGHPEANLRMGRAYELGQLNCPKDAALSIHYYNGAAQAGNAEGMMGLVAWYLVGAPPTLEANDMEAYEWAKRAAERGFAKAQYLVGYFLERGIGCRSDPLEANVWYVKAADQGQEQAIERLKLIREAAAGGAHGLPETEKKKGLLRKLGIN